MKTSDGTRLEYADIAKGIGIITVLFSHLGYNFAGIVPYYILMFVAASGCVFRYRRKSTDYCFKASKALIKKYFIYSGIVFILYIPLLFASVETGERTGFVLRNLIGILYARKALYYPYGIEPNVVFMEFGNSPMWFLIFLAVSWILFAIPMTIFNSEAKDTVRHPMLICTIVFCAYIVMTVLLSDIPILLPWSIDTAFMGAFFIMAGVLWEMMRDRYISGMDEGRWGRLIKAALFAAFALGYFFIYRLTQVSSNVSVRMFKSVLTDNLVMFFPFAIYGTAMLFMLCEALSGLHIGRLLSFIGHRSLVILCMHSVIFKYFAFCEQTLGFDSEIVSSIWYTVIKVSVTVTLLIAAEGAVSKLRHT